MTSKKLKSAYEKFNKEKAYSPAEAVKLMMDTKVAKFDPTAEVHLTLGIDPRHAEQQIRTTLSLPHGTGKTVRVVVVCEDDKVKEAKAAGAIEAGTDLVDKISKGWTDFDVVVATPSMMTNLAKVARVLGPKGLMPSPKAGTVTPDIEKAVTELVGGRIELRNEKNAIIHSIFGKLSFKEAQLLENLNTIINMVKEIKPSAAKGEYIKNVTINSTMGPGIKVSMGE